ncbi:MAG: DUF5723 family protein [Balneolales bacterium]
MERKSYKNPARIILLCLLVLMINSTIYAQRHTTARNLGLGGGGTAYMNDFHANFINPANLMLSESNATLGLLGGFSTNGGGQLADLSIYNEYFTTGRTINENLTLEISNKLFGNNPDGLRKIGFNVDAVLFGLNIKTKSQAISVAFRMRAMGSFEVSKGLFELSLGGLNESFFNEYKAVNLSGDVLTVGEVSLGYAREVWSAGNFGDRGSKRLFAGIAPKLLLGMNYYNTSFNSRLRVSENDRMVSHIFDYQINTAGVISEQLNDYHRDRNDINMDVEFDEYLSFEDAAPEMGSVQGTGLGVDLGVTYEMVMPAVSFLGDKQQLLRVSFSATDLGSVNFDKAPGRFSANGQVDWSGLEMDYARIDSEFNSSTSDYTSHVQDSITNDVYGNFAPEEISAIKVGLNPMINLGALYSAGKWNVMFDFGKGMNNRGMNSKRLSSVLGIEYNLANVIPIRTGMRVGGALPTSYSFGTGLNFRFLEFTLGFMTASNPFDNSVNIGAAWSGLILRY